MKLKRIVALGAVMLGLLAVPTTALASAPSPSQRPVAVRVACPPLRLLSPATVAAKTAARTVAKNAKTAPAAVAVYNLRAVACCGAIKDRKGIASGPVCPPWQPLVFDVGAWSSRFTVVHGPRLRVHDVISYRGGLYTVASVWGSEFTLDLRSKLYVNRGPAIHDGHAVILRGVLTVWYAPRPPK